jgi:hypothetical protein
MIFKAIFKLIFKKLTDDDDDDDDKEVVLVMTAWLGLGNVGSTTFNGNQPDTEDKDTTKPNHQPESDLEVTWIMSPLLNSISDSLSMLL